jgi:hypothetical protein
VADPPLRNPHALETGLVDQVTRARDAIEADLADFAVGR